MKGIMEFSREDSEFLCRYQRLVFDEKLEKGTASERADLIRGILAQLQFASQSNIVKEGEINHMTRDYQNMYADIVDSFDENSGLNNFAEGALALSRGNKNDSQNWKTSLTLDKVKSLPVLQRILQDTKESDAALMPDHLKNMPLPCPSKENIPIPASNVSGSDPQLSTNSFPMLTKTSTKNPSLDAPANHQSANQSSDKVMNLYGNQPKSTFSNSSFQERKRGKPQPDNGRGGYQQHDNGRGGYQQHDNGRGGYQQHDNGRGGYQQHDNGRGGYQQHDNGRGGYQQHDNGRGGYQQHDNGRGGYQQHDNGRGGYQQHGAQDDRMNRKSLFTSGRNGPWDEYGSKQTGPDYRGGNREGATADLKRGYHQTECDGGEMSRPSGGNNFVFKTAKQQLDIDNQRKYGGAAQSRGPVNTTSYGVAKKSLGTRRGPASRFVPPVMNKDEDEFSNEAANTITRAVLKTGGAAGGSGGGSKYGENMDDEKLKGVEPKMVELIMNEIMDTGSQLTWDDIAGLEFAKKTIKEIVVWPMLRPDIFTGLRGPPKGLLLFGPPGTGKTLIGKCIASQSKSTFFCISASSLTSKWVGEGEKMVRALFAVARSQQPAVVFIDEIDSLLTQRTDGENEASRRIKTEFLVQLDGASTDSEDRILVIGATNRPQEIDEAARRRFVKRLYIPLPENDARRTIITNLLKQQTYELMDEQLATICSRTAGFSGADMATLCREAALGPIRDMSFGDIEHISADQVRSINFADFEDALQHVRPSVSDKDLDLYIEWNNTFGSGSR